MNIQEIEEKMIQACDYAIAKGWQIKPNLMIREYLGYGNSQCCALGATIVATGKTKATWLHDRIAQQEYEMDEHQAQSFMDGFDNRYVSLAFRDEYYRLGERLRAKYIKVNE